MAGGVNANANGGSGRRSNASNRNGINAVEPRGRRRIGAAQPERDSSEDIERETEDESEEEETQIPIDEQTQDFQQMTQDLSAVTATATATRDTSPPPANRRSPPTSPPLPAAAAVAGSPTVPPANLSPSADVESTPASGEDDDSRSETGSEVSLGSGHTPRRSRARKRVTMACSDFKDLSRRLTRAVVPDGDDQVSFGETVVGADVVLCVRPGENRRPANGSSGHSGDVRRFHAHRFILAASSDPFRVMLTGTMRESKQRDVELHGIEPAVVEKMLLFMYTGDVVLDLESVLGLLIAAEMYELVALGEMCKDFVLKNADEVFCDPQIVQLPEKILLELIPKDELQIRELALMEALVMWGESRVANEDKPLGELLAEMMEFVRFPTMSVSDLYGKVRPLVSDGVIKEHLLTEALFNHLKWGSQTGVAAKRAKPRALTASLRKRKRVSFTQHVSFEPTTA